MQLYTGMVYRGPNIVSMIKKELRELLLKEGVKNFSEIVGKKQIPKCIKLDVINISPYIVSTLCQKNVN